MLLHAAGRPREAVAAYHRVLAAPGDRYFASLDRGVTGFKAHQNLAAAHADLGEWAEAEAAWRAVVRDAPGYRAGWRGWGEFLVLRDRLAEADELARGLGADPALALEGHVLAGRVAAARGTDPRPGPRGSARPRGPPRTRNRSGSWPANTSRPGPTNRPHACSGP
ncbi:hypothetical protein VT84_07230 [Gemmata sp. SH-PL17]|uniref:hypothetical protein n=1 Tax=Gemmata sp. SH-PL17 TaxID=1630693 RepID=UPI00078C463F|nr:hypothetical protein [Gemmata sp. SH-PL17]AMV24172.1 hypothetical protein VT84_07230 [Gemmata sp. SH-PL17]